MAVSWVTLFCILTGQKQDLTQKKFLWLVIVSGHHSKIILSLVTVILPGKVLLGQSFVGLVSQHEGPQTLSAALCYRSHVRVRGSITPLPVQIYGQWTMDHTASYLIWYLSCLVVCCMDIIICLVNIGVDFKEASFHGQNHWWHAMCCLKVMLHRRIRSNDF